MLRLLISEDEALERKAIRFLLNQYYSKSIQIIGEVSNGRDAVNKSLELKPDIILMDIEMPILSGLDAGSMIKSSLKDAEFVILTAFNYFNYAKSAITLGVSDYLLKPYSNEEFCATIDKLIVKINAKKRNKSENEEIHQKYEESIPFVEKEMVTNIVYGIMLTLEKLDQYKKILDISSSQYCCIIFRTLGEQNRSIAEIQEIKKQLKIIFSTVIGDVCLNDMVFFLFDDMVDEKMLSGKFAKMIHNIEETNSSLSFGHGCCGDSAENLFLSYRQAKLFLGKTARIKDTATGVGTASRFGDDLKEQIVSISGKIINEDPEGALSEVDGLWDSLIRKNETDDFDTISEAAVKIMNGIKNNVMEFMGEADREMCGRNGGPGDIKCNNLMDIKNQEHLTVKNLIRLIANYKRKKNIDMVEKVKKYIALNFMKEISLEDMARYICISSYYLSRIFRTVEGINFKDYLIKVRMEKAKSLLTKESKSVKEVSAEVGYSDQNYFSKAFKKYTNLSPKEYINS